jgi:recombinational DNA repair ATPase RecF
MSAAGDTTAASPTTARKRKSAGDGTPGGLTGLDWLSQADDFCEQLRRDAAAVAPAPSPTPSSADASSRAVAGSVAGAVAATAAAAATGGSSLVVSNLCVSRSSWPLCKRVLGGLARHCVAEGHQRLVHLGSFFAAQRVSSERSAEMALLAEVRDFFRDEFPPQLGLVLVAGQRDIIADSEKDASFLFLLQGAGVAQIQVVHVDAVQVHLQAQFPGLLLVPFVRQPDLCLLELIRAARVADPSIHTVCMCNPLSLEARDPAAERNTLHGLPAIFASDLLPTDTFTLVSGYEREMCTLLSGTSALYTVGSPFQLDAQDGGPVRRALAIEEARPGGAPLSSTELMLVRRFFLYTDGASFVRTLVSSYHDGDAIVVRYRQAEQAAVLEHQAAIQQYGKATVDVELKREYAARPSKLSQPAGKNEEEEKEEKKSNRSVECGESVSVAPVHENADEAGVWEELGLEDADDATFVKQLILDTVRQLGQEECKQHEARVPLAANVAVHQAKLVALREDVPLRIQAAQDLWDALFSGVEAAAVELPRFPFVEVSSASLTEFSFVHGASRTYQLARFGSVSRRAHIVHLAGENGAGKSSLMLALQWGLTGSVRSIVSPTSDDVSEFINEDAVALGSQAHASVDVNVALHLDPRANAGPTTLQTRATTDAASTAGDLLTHLRRIDPSFAANDPDLLTVAARTLLSLTTFQHDDSMSDWILQLPSKNAATQLPELTIFAHRRLAVLRRCFHAASEAYTSRSKQYQAALKESNKQVKLYQEAATLLQQRQQALKATGEQVLAQRAASMTLPFATLTLPELKKDMKTREEGLVGQSSSEALRVLQSQMQQGERAKSACGVLQVQLQELRDQLQVVEKANCRSCTCNTAQQLVAQRRAAVKAACATAAALDKDVDQDISGLSLQQLPSKIEEVQQHAHAWQRYVDGLKTQIMATKQSVRHQAYLDLVRLRELVKVLDQQQAAQQLHDASVQSCADLQKKVDMEGCKVKVCAHERDISEAIQVATAPDGLAAKQLRRHIYTALTALTNVILQQHFPARPPIVIEEPDDSTRVAISACLKNGGRRSWSNCSQGQKNSMALGLSCALRRMMYQRLGLASSVIFLDEVFCHVDVAGFKVCLECVQKEAQRQVDYLGQPLTVYLIAHSSDVLPVLQEMGPHTCSSYTLDRLQQR